jgi:CO/xanthine dehydrogenase FAD-binding subunit
LKYCSLSPNDWPTVGVAAFLRADGGRAADVRIVVGSVADQPLRLRDAEQILEGEQIRANAITEIAQRYAEQADPIADVRGSVEYKRRVTGVFVQRAIEEAARRAGLAVVA